MRKFLFLLVFIILTGLSAVVFNYAQNRKDSQSSQTSNLNTVVTVTDNSLFLEDSPEIKVEIPENLRNYLLEFISQDIDCNSSNPIEFPYDLRTEKTDLNNDQKFEYIVYPLEICGVTLRTASGNGTILVLREIDKKWNVVGELYGTSYQLEDTLTNDFRDITTMTNESFKDKRFSTFKWHKDADEQQSKYILESDEIVVLNEDEIWE